MRWKPTLLESLVIIATVGVLMALLLPGPDQDRSPRYPAVAVSGVNLAKVAGDYDWPNGRGRRWNLSILADGRYSFVWSGCVGVLHREAGQAREVDGKIVLTPEIPNDRKVVRELLPVRWDERKYLVRPDQVSRFCQAVEAGLEPSRRGVATFYLSNPQGRAEGLPEVPEEFLADLQKRLIFGKIIEVRSLGTRAKVALGSKDGVKVQDVLRLQGADRVAGLRVVAVEDESCLVDALEPGSYDDLLKPGGTVLFDRPKRP